MKALFFLIVVIALLAFAGWLTFNSGPGRASVNLETNEIREDTQEIVRSGAKIIDRAGDKPQPSDEVQQPVEREANRSLADRE